MAPAELSLLRKLCAEVDDVAQKDAGAGLEASRLFRDFLEASTRYNSAVSNTTWGAKAPEGDYPSDREAWHREIENADKARRSAHNVVIDSYKILVRYCRLYRQKDMSIEAKYPPDAERAALGDLAHIIRRGIDQAKCLDQVFFERLFK